MRLDQVSGWQLLAAQLLALLIVGTTLWLVGVAFQRSRVARWVSLLLAVLIGAGIAAGVLRADEAFVSSFLFAAVMFLLGTVGMSILLLAAVPQTRGAALGGMVAGGLLLISFVLTYYALFALMPVKWIVGS